MKTAGLFSMVKGRIASRAIVICLLLSGCVSVPGYTPGMPTDSLLADVGVDNKAILFNGLCGCVKASISESSGWEFSGIVLLTRDALHIVVWNGELKRYQSRYRISLRDIRYFAQHQLPLGASQIQIHTADLKLAIGLHRTDVGISERFSAVQRDKAAFVDALRVSGVKQENNVPLIGTRIR
jgi:hypothetical protein